MNLRFTNSKKLISLKSNKCSKTKREIYKNSLMIRKMNSEINSSMSKLTLMR